MSTALERSHLPTRVTGSSWAWTRDVAVLGGATGWLAPGAVLSFTDPIALVGGLVGLATGASLGAMLPRLLEMMRGSLPIPLLLVAGVVGGALWGALVGAVTATVLGTATFAGFGAAAGALTAGLQFGWFWFPYTFQTVRRGRTWPVLAAACGMAPAIGWLAIATLSVLLSV